MACHLPIVSSIMSSSIGRSTEYDSVRLSAVGRDPGVLAFNSDKYDAS